MNKQELVEFYKKRMEWETKRYLGVRPYSIRKPKKEPKSEVVPSRLRIFPAQFRIYPPR
jgi:hypothetical protein